MRAAALLDGLVGGPRQLEGDVHAPPPVVHAPVRLERDVRFRVGLGLGLGLGLAALTLGNPKPKP